MKLLVDAETDKVIGASMCGPDAPEIMQVFSILPVKAFQNYIYFPAAVGLNETNLLININRVLPLP